MIIFFVSFELCVANVLCSFRAHRVLPSLCTLIAVMYFDGRWLGPIVNIYDNWNILDGRRSKKWKETHTLGKNCSVKRWAGTVLSSFFLHHMLDLYCHCAALNIISSVWWIEHEQSKKNSMLDINQYDSTKIYSNSFWRDRFVITNLMHLLLLLCCICILLFTIPKKRSRYARPLYRMTFKSREIYKISIRLIVMLITKCSCSNL